MKWRIEAFRIVIFSMYFKEEVLEMGIPFCKNQGFPKLSPCYITTWEFPL